LKAGTICIDDKSTIDYLLRDLSNAGASLEMENAIGVADGFTLVMKADGTKRACHVTRWLAGRIEHA
jgi:hypothetical protein